MKLWFLNTGYLETDKNNVVGCSVIGTYSNPHIQNKWIKLPVMAFLIETADGFILYDTGSNPEAMNGYWPDNLREIYPLYQKTEEYLENQLSLCGVKPEDIKTVVISHMHLDHAGGLYLFPHADIYVPKEDYEYAQVMVHKNPNPTEHGGYVKADCEVAGNYILVDHDIELTKGIELICLPGHTPNLLGVIVHLDSQTFILPQDAVYTMEIYGPPTKSSGFLYDSIGYYKSIEKIRELQNVHQATVIPAHDWEFFQTLKTAPEYYD